MKLFISWSGERSKLIATALKEWLPLVLHFVDPWLSEADIEAGQRWADAVAKELEVSKFGVLCVTRENLNSPWVLFEAGALAKSLEGARVTPLLFGLDFTDITGPLAQFQAKKLEKKGVLELVHSLNQSAPQPVPEDRYRQLFEALWPELEKKVGQVPQAPAVARQARSQTEVLEELVEAVRAMETRMREAPEEPRYVRKRDRPMFTFLRGLSELGINRSTDPLAILIFASHFREDVPWLYELGLDAYRALKAGSKAESKRALSDLLRATELTFHGPLSSEELLGSQRHASPREVEFMLMDLLHSHIARIEAGKV